MQLAVTEQGEGRVVALLHGLFGAGQNFGAIHKALAASHQVLAMDLRNHGASPHAASMTYPEMAADVAETLLAAGAVPAAVVGHSMGGKVAMALALARPDMVSRLVVADIAPVPYPPAFRGFADAMQGLTLTPGLTRKSADAALAAAVPEAGVRAFLLQNLRFDTDLPAWRIGLGAIAASLPGIEDWPALPGRYEGPALFVSGERSDYIRPEHHAAIRALFPAARFATVPRAGHWVHAENPGGFLEAILPFIEGT
jgi:pimeloyl-ACP methyl ester carboxylesterase